MRKIISVMAIALLLSACQMANLKTSSDHRQSLMTALDTQKDGYAGLIAETGESFTIQSTSCLLYTSPSPRDQRGSRMPSSA